MPIVLARSIKMVHNCGKAKVNLYLLSVIVYKRRRIIYCSVSPAYNHQVHWVDLEAQLRIPFCIAQIGCIEILFHSATRKFGQDSFLAKNVHIAVSQCEF